MYKTILLVWGVFCSVNLLVAQAPQLMRATEERPVPTPAELAETITADDMKAHLTVLASDDFEGRETGTEGQKKAAAYLAEQFRLMGLPTIGTDNSYFQEIAYTAFSWDKISAFTKKDAFKHLWDFYSFPSLNADLSSTEYEEIIFLGYGIDDERYSDYKGVDVAGKVVLVYDGEPANEAGISYLTDTEELSEWSTEFRKKFEAAHQNGAVAVLLIDPNIQKGIAQNRSTLLSSRMQIGKGEEPEGKYANSLFISTTMAKTIMGKRYKKVIKARDQIKAGGQPANVKLKGSLTIEQDKGVRQMIGENVLGFIEGSDPALKDEVVILTAHYDHLGKRGEDIYNGADDNGSGTSTILEVAQALAKAKKKGVGPKRSVLCMLVSGEEKGLLGSRYYVENPIFPLENTVANVNVDMVGRVDDQHLDNPNYVYVIGSDRLSTELHAVNETANATYTQLELDYTYNAEDDPNRYYYRSDHYNFAERGIPAIFYFNGTHADYHRTSDTVDKINFDKMALIGKLVFHVSWELANRAERIKVDVTD